MEQNGNESSPLIPLTFNDILYASPRLDAQLVLWVIHAVIWYIIVNLIVYPIMLNFVHNMKTKQKLIDLHRAGMKKAGITIDWDDNTILEMNAEMFSILAQHFVGGLLCVPSAVGMLPANVVCAMARHGMLCELGWETEDSAIKMYHIIFGGEQGRKRNPPVMTILGIVLHHILSFTMVIPLNIYYPNWTAVHEMTSLLQLAAAVCATLQFYGYTKDIKTYTELMKMKTSIIISFAMIIWSRVIRYFWLIWIIMSGVWADGNTHLFSLMCLPLVIFTMFNLLMLHDAIRKLMKFLPMQIDPNDDKDTVAEAVADLVAAPVLVRRLSSVDNKLARRLSSVNNSFAQKLSRGLSFDNYSAGDDGKEKEVQWMFQAADSHIKEE